MIKDIEKLKKEMKQKIDRKIDEYVNAMNNGFNQDSFSINEIEKIWGEAIQECNNVLKDGTEQMINAVDESSLISKKKVLAQK